MRSLHSFSALRSWFLGACSMLLLSCPGFAQPDTLTIGGIRERLLRHPVAPFGDTLFHIQARAGSFTAETRASAIQKRIKDRATRALRLNDTLRIDSADGVLDIFYGEDLLVTVTPKDAAAEGVAMGVLAQDWRTAISGAIAGYQQSISFMTLAKEIALALLVTGILLFVLRMVRRGFRWTHAWLIRQKGTRIKGVKIRDYEFFTEERSLNALLLVNKIVRWLVVLLVLYITLPVLFAIFPWTQDLAEVLFGYITRPVAHIAMALWDFLPDLITIAVIVLVFRYVIKGLAFLRDEVRTGALVIPGFYTDWATPTFQLLRVVLYAFMVVVVFPYLPGSDSPVFQGVTVFLGALFTFGSAGSLSNIIAGLVLTYMRSFQKGDRVRIGEVFGDVIERNMLVTRVRTTKNEIISIPNSTVINSHTINYTSDSAERGLIIHSTVTIGYDVPWRQVHELLIAAAKKTELIEAEPAPFVLQTSLDDFYVSYEINCYTKQTTRQAFIYSQLHENIQDRFNAAAVEIMSPHYRAMRDGNRTTMSSDQVPPDYEEPSFRVRFRSDGPKPDKSGL